MTPSNKQPQSSPVAGAEGSTGTPAATAATTIPGSAGADVVRGLDLSHYQKPSSIKWAELAKSHGFVILNATDGTKPDSSFLEHAKRALDVGLVVGAYLFYRPVHHVDDQVAAFGELVESAGMGPGWLVPAIDVEKNEKYDGAFTPERYVDSVHAIAELWEGKWGKPLIYTNPAEWSVLGNPEWLSDYLLWLAHHTTKKPWTPPGSDWTIWQFTGKGRLPDVYSGDLDMNVARSLPLIGTAAADTDRAPALIQPEVDWEEQNRDRDRDVQEKP